MDLFVRTTCTDNACKSRSVYAECANCVFVCACLRILCVCDLLERTTFPDSCLVCPHMLTKLACRLRHELSLYLQQIRNHTPVVVLEYLDICLILDIHIYFISQILG